MNQKNTEYNLSSFWSLPGSENRDLNQKMAERMEANQSFRIRNNQRLISEQPNNPITAIAKYDMAQCYRYGWGVPINAEESIKLYTESANMGHAGACYELVRLYLRDNSLMHIQKDLAAAKKYLDMGISNDSKVSDQMDIGGYRNSDYVKELKKLEPVLDFYQTQSFSQLR